jgi:hypothetical protein
MLHRTILVLLAALILVAPSALAQEQNGAIQGVARDPSGGVLPGVTVEARSDALVGVSAAVTDASGAYRFPALPPGVYTLSASLEGFNSAKVEAVTVGLGQILKIDLTLTVGGVAETVNVTGGAPIIDVKQSAAYATLESQTIERLPKGRDFTSVIAMAPGAQAEAKSGGEAQIDGASGAENRFILDGMDTTSLLRGTSGKQMPIDFIQQVQVKSSGYAAEFGGAMGGVVSAITKSGSNQLRGSGGVYFQNDGFYGKTRPQRMYSPWNTNNALTGMIPYVTPWTYVSPVVDVGGPVFKDRLWYYGGLAYHTNRFNEDVVFIGDPTLTRRHFEWGNFSYYPNYNVTTQLSPSMRLRVSGSNQRSGERKTAPGGPGYTATGVLPTNLVYDGTVAALVGKTLDRYTAATFTTDQAVWDRTWDKYATDATNDMFAANFDWILTPRIFINTTVGYFRTNNRTSPDMRGDQSVRTFRASNTDATMAAAGFPTVPLTYQGATGTYDNISNTGIVRDIYSRLYVNANASWYKSWKGQHMFKAGVRLERFANDVLNGPTKANMSLYWGRKYTATDGRVLAGTYGYFTVNQLGYVGDVASNNVALWVQDGWSVNSKLTVNAGVRLENEHIPSFVDGLEGVTFGFGKKVAPRLGFAYDLHGDSTWKVYGSFGTFFDVTKLALARTYFGAFNGAVYYWPLNTFDWKSIQCEATATGCPGLSIFERVYVSAPYNVQNDTLAAYFNRPGMTSIDPALEPTESGEAVAGLDHQLNDRWSIGARYVHKWLFRTIEDVGLTVPGKGSFSIMSNPGYGYSAVMNPTYPSFTTPPAKRDYDAVEIRVRRRFADRWSAELAYTYSRLYGNYSGLSSSDQLNTADGSGSSTPNISAYYDAVYQSYDRNNQKVYGRLATDRPHVVKLWATYQTPWGTSIGLNGFVQSGLLQTSMLRWASSGYTIYFNGRGDLGRTPAVTQLDLQLSHELKLGASRRLVVEANILNLFDADTVTGYYLTSGAGTSPWRDNIAPGDAVFFGGAWNPATVVANLRAVNGAASIRDEAFYGLPNYYQQRREMRLSAKFSF